MRLIQLALIGGILSTACSGASADGSGASGAAGAAAYGNSGSGGTGTGTGGTWGTGGAVGATGGTSYSGGSSAGGSGSIVTACPHDPPTDGVPCRTGLACSYGDDPRASCRTRYDCGASAWVATAGTCADITACSSYAATPYDGRSCADVGANCWTFNDAYNFNVDCMCGTCSGSVCSSTWNCGGVPAPGCPRVIPNLGQPCGSTTPAECVYGVCPDSTAAVCQGGVWTWTSLCPVAAK